MSAIHRPTESILPQDLSHRCGIPLQHVCEIVLHRDDSGNIILYDYNAETKESHNQDFHRYGLGPFCHFRIPQGHYAKEGVYFIFEDETALKYIGETINLETRFIEGYGRIDRKNCLIGGQMTNCRLNNLIYHSIRHGHRISLYFFETDNRKKSEENLIDLFNPSWNILKNKQNTLKNDHQNLNQPSSQKVSSGKYLPLQQYLSGVTGNTVNLSYTEIEKILGFSLPPSAYKYQRWWDNGDATHIQSYSWKNSGWKVSSVQLGNKVIFQRIS